MKLSCIAIFCLFVMMSSAACAEVIEAKENGFVVRQVYEINAKPHKVFLTLVQPKNWWQSDHTWSGDANNLSMDVHAGGCFCEALMDGGSVSHMTVVYVAPNEALRLYGALGPLQMTGANGSMGFDLKPTDTGTRLTMTYTVGGYMQGGFQNIAPMVDQVLKAQFSNLKAVSEVP